MSANHDIGSTGNDLLQKMIHSFIIKIWREDSKEGERPTWRGHITHVPGNERRYLKILGEIPDFIRPYLERMGVRVGHHWSPGRWLKRGESSGSSAAEKTKVDSGHGG